MNQTFIIGNIVRDAELTSVNVNGVSTPMCKFSVAVNETRSNGEGVVTYFEVAAWRKYAQKIAPYLTKGRQVHVSGQVRLHTYVGNDKMVHASIQIHNPIVTFLGKKQTGVKAAETEETLANAETVNDLDELNDDDIPW